MEEKNPNVLYKDIINGYSTFRYKDDTVYLKHVSPIDQSYLDEVKEKALLEASQEGLLKEQELIKVLIENLDWSEEKESSFNSSVSYIENLQKTKASLVIPSQIESINTQIKEAEAKLEKIRNERENLVGLTAEVYAARKENEHSLRLLLYKDNIFSNPLFPGNTLDDVEEIELIKLLMSVKINLREFSSSNLKKIAIQDTVNSILSYMPPEVDRFYGKCGAQLSIIQMRFFGYLKLFNYILTNNKDIPEHIQNDPDALMDWHLVQNNLKKMENSPRKKPGEGQSTSFIGANKQDMKNMGIQTGNRAFIDALKKKGGQMGIMDMMKLRQVI